jgi:hypothetical protein
MPDTVELVAQAIFAPDLHNRGRDHVWRRAAPETRAHYRRAARAAIDALQHTEAGDG